ncbi:CASC3/barentsz eIF4AIII-binding protein [Quillaja saponaria]|uniref:CASC3/barentsz eIF4AIII-binding protein n=1 Tax=Quillaja saponaria TaxID=32244 RepID=A0AAD7PQB4_QUISA|nr:CASC3/barentsz eIF4AIII-binding protein [Quillaja saponaria]KAJ7962956.1 CASC3/barentsz eIF4AIII-binding protein [Quillaja saponaria]
MANAGEEELEYESDPEEVKRSLSMRRREASDDEEGEGEGREKIVDHGEAIHSDESDDQGGVAEYDDEEELDEGEDVDEEDVVEEGDEVEEEEIYVEGGHGEESHGALGVEGSVVIAKEPDSDVKTSLKESVDGNVEHQDGEEEKKENEPFAVPTAGAFYMHDDRFRDNAGGRHRRFHGGRRLWESKDDKKWGHDKFEELTLHERHYEEGRRSKANYRSRGKSRGVDHGYAQGNRKGYSNSNNQSQVSKSVRGRGPRRYEPTWKNNGQAPQLQSKQYGKPLEKTSHASSGRAFTPTSNVESDSAAARKQVFASSLNYASPPFYPSGSSNKNIALALKRDVQTGSTSRSVRPTVTDEGFSVPQTKAFRGKNIADSIGMDKLYMDESATPAAGKPVTNLQMPSSGSLGVNAVQSPQPRVPGRGTITGRMNYQQGLPHNQFNRVSTAQLQSVQQSPAQSRIQNSGPASDAQSGQRAGIESQGSSPPKSSVAINSFEPQEVDSTSESSKSKGALVGKGRASAQGSGRGSFLYGGAQVMGASGNMGTGSGDQNFPAFLPVMQFGGQHPGGMGVPAVGMAFPGYVAQPQLGSGKSEMTWLPVLAGAAGAFGATYCPPYLTVDGAYHARQSGQTSSVGASSKENNTNKSTNEWKPSQGPELVSDEFGQRQNKPRRYSEMNFGQ